MSEDKNSYFICTSPRSGSTLLCDLLSATNLTGLPDSYFMRQFIQWWAEKLDVSVENWSDLHEFDELYLSAVMQDPTNGTQTHGIRMMWDNVTDLTERLKTFYPDISNTMASFQHVFGKTSYLYLSREDKIAQAVSLLKAKQSGLWHIHPDGTERERLHPKQRLVYDFKSLYKIKDELENNELSWQKWFSKHKIKPMHISYESLSSSPQNELSRVLTFLGIDLSIVQQIEPRTSKLGDDLSIEWINRFRKEYKNH